MRRILCLSGTVAEDHGRHPKPLSSSRGLAKKMMLAQAQAYREQYGTNTVVLFPVNLYGPRDNFD